MPHPLRNDGTIDWSVFPVVDRDLGKLTPIDTLLYYDGPLIWTAIGPDGQFYYVCRADENPDVMFVLVVPMSSEMIAKIKNDQITLHEVLMVDLVYVVEWHLSHRIVRRASGAELHPDCVPVAGVFLHREKEWDVCDIE